MTFFVEFGIKLQRQQQCYISTLHGSGGNFQVTAAPQDHLESFESKFSFGLDPRFNLEDFFSPVGPRGVELSGPIWSPARLFINLANWAFVFVVPILYGAIYKFRKTHTVKLLGTSTTPPFRCLFSIVHHLYCCKQVEEAHLHDMI